MSIHCSHQTQPQLVMDMQSQQLYHHQCLLVLVATLVIFQAINWHYLQFQLVYFLQPSPPTLELLHLQFNIFLTLKRKRANPCMAHLIITGLKFIFLQTFFVVTFLVVLLILLFIFKLALI